MTSTSVTEDFCTIFDSSFLTLGIAMYRSLKSHCPSARLWILAMDQVAAETLKKLDLLDVKVIPVQDIENDTLLGLKKSRSKAEYCWTLSPYFPWWLIKTQKIEHRITYIDADLYFFSDPRRILAELELSGREVLITEHAYDPKYDQTATSGRFCVQFMTFLNRSGGLKVLEWWKERCIEWCFAKFEDGKFGDQKYLDEWPRLFPNEVHILQNKYLALAPWNVEFARRNTTLQKVDNVFFHFHSFRFYNGGKARLCVNYKLSRESLDAYYVPYINELASIKKTLANFENHIPLLKDISLKDRVKRIFGLLLKTQRESSL